MRRNVTNTRNQPNVTKKDYQTIINLGNPKSLIALEKFTSRLTLEVDTDNGIFALGGYVFGYCEKFIVKINDKLEVVKLQNQLYWTRFGITAEVFNNRASISLEFFNLEKLHIWGLAFGNLESEKLNISVHAPEIYYLQHSENFPSFCCENVIIETSDRLAPGKKCSQCGRSLPIDPNREAKLKARKSECIAFHGHAKKRTGYQNECIACKTIRINASLNNKRTKDQLHESSVISRERAKLLGKNMVLNKFKKVGGGFKSYIWDKFNKSCFKCKKVLLLENCFIDHTRPFSYLWPLDEHATCLCEVCNNAKKDAFPVDFYNEQELSELSVITGLSLDLLRKRDMNIVALEKVIDNLDECKEKHTKLFHSINRRVKQLYNIDLCQIYDKEKQQFIYSYTI